MIAKLFKKEGKGLPASVKLFIPMIPSIIICYLFSYRPLIGLGYAFVEYKPMVSLWDSEFVGSKYFKMLVENPIQRREILRVLRNTLVMAGIGYLTSFFPIFITLLLNEIRSRKYKKIVQTLITIPNFISWVIVYAAFYNILAPSSGLLSVLLREWGIIEGNFELMTNAKYGWLFMYILDDWKGLGWGCIVYLATLSSADSELYEAAEIDGAGRFQKMRYISFPVLLPTYITLMLINIGHILSSDFGKVFNFANAFNRTTVETLDLYIYRVGLGSLNISLGTTVGLAKSVIGLALMFFGNYLAKKIRGTAIF